MFDKKMGEMEETSPELKAKMEVVKAIRKMAMELLAKGADGEEDAEAVVAKLDMQKVPAEEAVEVAEEEMGEEDEEDAEGDLKLLDKMIQKKKQMA